MRIKNLFNIALFFILGLMVFSSCGDELTTGKGPSAVFENGTGSDVTVNSGEEFTVRITAGKGSDDLKTVEVFADGIKIDASRIKFDGVEVAANPFILFGTDVSGFTSDFAIKAHTNDGVKIYSFNIADINGNVKSLSKSVTVIATPPTVTYAGSAVINSGVSMLTSVKISASGLSNLASIEVKEDGLLVDAGRLYLDALLFTSNPFPLPAQYQTGITDAMVVVRTPAAVGTYNYVLKVTDVNGLSGEISFSIQTGEATSIKRGVLLNQSGPMGTGGLDLDDAVSTGSSDLLAEIKDEGIDLNLPAATNWIQKISGVNGSEIKYIVPGVNGVNEAFDLTFVNYKEQLTSLWNSGVALTGTSSNKVKTGDFFIVRNGDKYYLLETVKVVVTSGDNGDYYEFDILK